MEQFDGFEYSKRDVLGHGAFAIVYRGRYVEVSISFIEKLEDIHLRASIDKQKQL